MKQYEINNGSGKHKIYLYATVTTGGIMANLVGGDRPHLGAVVLALPGRSLPCRDVVSCTSSIIPLTGHKDDEAARPLAEMLAKETELPVSIAAGIHIDNASAEDIEIVKKNCLDCGRMLISLIQSKN